MRRPPRWSRTATCPAGLPLRCLNCRSPGQPDMPRAPAFWRRGGGTLLPCLLSPFAAAVAGVTAYRVSRPGWRAPVPVICCGNVTVGGAGKTTLALDLAGRLRAAGIAVHVLTRGYGGRVHGPLRVDPARHDADAVGDEPLLLAALAPTWVG